MNAIKFLYAAYISVWLIHGVYIASLLRRYKSLRREAQELGKARNS
jgi:CcmD family protein